jgi:hypothetical protein
MRAVLLLVVVGVWSSFSVGAVMLAIYLVTGRDPLGPANGRTSVRRRRWEMAVLTILGLLAVLYVGMWVYAWGSGAARIDVQTVVLTAPPIVFLLLVLVAATRLTQRDPGISTER